jgi:hypothetical protein
MIGVHGSCGCLALAVVHRYERKQAHPCLMQMQAVQLQVMYPPGLL